LYYLADAARASREAVKAGLDEHATEAGLDASVREMDGTHGAQVWHWPRRRTTVTLDKRACCQVGVPHFSWESSDLLGDCVPERVQPVAAIAAIEYRPEAAALVQG